LVKGKYYITSFYCFGENYCFAAFKRKHIYEYYFSSFADFNYVYYWATFSFKKEKRMERTINLSKKNVLLLLYSIYIVGLIGHVISVTREFMFRLTPLALLISSLIVIVSIIDNKKLFYWLIVTYIITLLLEIIGVKTGTVFGEYSYGNILGIKFFDVPLIIGLNWVIIIWGGILFSQKITFTPFWVAAATGSLALLFDIFLEPVAISFGYWDWTNTSVPVHNYIAWFVIAYSFSFIYTYLKIHTKSNVPIHLFFIQLVFFLLLNILVIS
jgi:putative membrane protein